MEVVRQPEEKIGLILWQANIFAYLQIMLSIWSFKYKQPVLIRLLMDVLTPEQRHRNMSRIRSANTKPEKRVRSLLHHRGYRFRLHSRNLPGTPDIILPKYRTAIFVHGCFWHRHDGCKEASIPKTNTERWAKKFYENVKRDRQATSDLEALGWSVIVIWECELRKMDELTARVLSLLHPA